MNLNKEIIDALWLVNRIKNDLPDADEAELISAIESETNLTEALTKLVRSMEEDRLMVAALNLRIEELSNREERFKRRIDRLRHLIADAMTKTGLKTLKREEFTAVIMPGCPSASVNMELLPDEYKSFKEPTPKFKEITDAIKAGKEVPGARLCHSAPYLVVRRS